MMISMMMKINQPIPLSVISHANETQNFDTLRVWILLKQLYKRNTVIYNLNYATLSRLTDISHTSLRKHVKIMIRLKWATIANSNLHLTGINKLKKHPKETCIPVPVEKHKQDQIAQLRFILVKRNINNQQKQINRKSSAVNKCNRPHAKLSKKEMKMVTKAGGVKKLESSLQSVTTLSNRSIGKLFQLSQITGHRIQKRLRNMNLIKTTTRLVLVKSNSTTFEQNYCNTNFTGGYIFNPSSSSLYRRLSNSIQCI